MDAVQIAEPVTRALFDEVMLQTYAPPDVIPVRGAGSRIWDQAGRDYLDFAGGIAVCGLGHCHPALVAALEAQAHKLWHVSNVMTTEPALRLARELVAATFADRVFFCNSGGEANEIAFKLARLHGHGIAPGKDEIVSCYNSFHGRTLFTVSVGGQEKYTHGYEPLPAGITHVAFNDPAALERAVTNRTCAVVLEPVQGEGGIMPATQEYIEAARRICDAHDALLIYDEVQCGFGRTGKLYAYQHYGVAPDVMTSAKALGGGFPIAAMLCTQRAAKRMTVGAHGSTYGGNPLACAVSLAALEIINTPEVLHGVVERSTKLRAGIDAIGARHGLFAPARGMGLLIGAPMAPAWQGRAREVMAAALKHGLWCLIAGPNVVRFAPSLIIPDADLDEGLARLDATCRELAG
ncbi:MAG: acetylornithine/succinylornithine family transaminase [Nevskiaceae bacterium]|nr:MAG: acetylornithine/succinylornithine family transaminase [Nevskiaceae bacterium]TBR74803.1 MAG: acetylornithine/succinylornithine family transaminase [Nevskiaceae bacterium]